MRLTDLDPQYVSHGSDDGTVTREGIPVPYRDRVGVSFECPCGSCGSRVYILFNNPPDGGPCCDVTQNHWYRSGDSFENLTLTPSIQRMQPNCKWHGFVTNGAIVNA